jgi:hypothetical protein
MMASGAILGDCYVCSWHVYEDEAVWYNNKLKHGTCKTKSSLMQENEMLRRELEDYHRWLKNEEWVKKK